MSNERKVAVIGLDCAAPRLVFEDWTRELPHLNALMSRGLYGPLESCHPPITVPAWSVMMSSKDPGQLGFYGFRNRSGYTYDGYTMASSKSVTHDRVWDILSRADKRVILLGVPQTYPPRPVNGSMVTCFLTPSNQSRYTHPPELREEIERVSGGYIFDVEGFRTGEKGQLLNRIYDKTRKHFTVAKHLLKNQPWDYFMMVEMGVDRIHHGFWEHMDPTHPKYQPGNPYEEAIRTYYRYVDGEVGEVLHLLGDETAVFVVSDHGAKKMDGAVCINEWLMQQGHLTLRAPVAQATPIGQAPIDWDRTSAWGDGGYYGRLFFNVKGREPHGTIARDDYERFRTDMISEIEALPGPDGRPLGTKAHRPEELYRECRGVAPDLIVYFGNLDWRSVGSVGIGSAYTFDNDTGPDGANHDWHGISILVDPARPGAGRRMDGLRITDIAPTILDLFGLPVPDDMIGRVITSATAAQG